MDSQNNWKPHYHCVLSSDPNCNEEETNLQLHFLKLALEQWQKLKFDQHNGLFRNEREHYIGVIILISTSVTQLLGQNATPSSNPKRVESPIELFKDFRKKDWKPSRIGQGETEYEVSVAEFKELIEIYDDGRHFGVTQSGNKHTTIENLNLPKTEKCIQTALGVWLMMLNAKGMDQEDFDEFKSYFVVEFEVFP